MRNKLTFVRKTICILSAGVLFSGLCFAGENAKVKELDPDTGLVLIYLDGQF